MLRRLINWLSPALMQPIEIESRSWQIHCPGCAQETSVWDAGGLRHRALGNAYRLGRCRGCGKLQLLHIIKASDSAP